MCVPGPLPALTLTTGDATALTLFQAPSVAISLTTDGAVPLYTASTLPSPSSASLPLTLTLKGGAFTPGAARVACDSVAGAIPSALKPDILPLTATASQLVIPLDTNAPRPGSTYTFTIRVVGTRPASVQLQLHVLYGGCG